MNNKNREFSEEELTMIEKFEFNLINLAVELAQQEYAENLELINDGGEFFEMVYDEPSNLDYIKEVFHYDVYNSTINKMTRRYYEEYINEQSAKYADAYNAHTKKLLNIYKKASEKSNDFER